MNAAVHPNAFIVRARSLAAIRWVLAAWASIAVSIGITQIVRRIA